MIASSERLELHSGNRIYQLTEFSYKYNKFYKRKISVTMKGEMPYTTQMHLKITKHQMIRMGYLRQLK